MELKALALILAFGTMTWEVQAQLIPSNTTQLAKEASDNMAEIEQADLVTCSVDLSKNNEFIQVANVNGQKSFLTDGDQITLTINDSEPKLEVLVKYYRSDIEDDGLPEKRIEVLINNLTKETQEDYLSSKLKSFLYITKMKGLYTYKPTDSNASYKFEFDAINVECSVE